MGTPLSKEHTDRESEELLTFQRQETSNVYETFRRRSEFKSVDISGIPILHHVSDDDTFPGLLIRYGADRTEVHRINGMYSDNDLSLHRFLLIPQRRNADSLLSSYPFLSSCSTSEVLITDTHLLARNSCFPNGEDLKCQIVDIEDVRLIPFQHRHPSSAFSAPAVLLTSNFDSNKNTRVFSLKLHEFRVPLLLHCKNESGLFQLLNSHLSSSVDVQPRIQE